MRLSAPRLAISAAVIGTAAVTTSVAFAAAGPDESAPVTKAGAPTTDRSSVLVSDVSATSTTNYWTPARMRAAKPLPLPKTAKPTPVGNSYTAAEQLPADVAPAPVSGTVGTAGDVGATYVTAAKQYPYLRNSSKGYGIARTSGRLFFQKANGANYVCSATVVNAANRHTVWTAAHCLHDGGTSGKWHKNLVFVPAYRDGKAPLGKYSVAWMKVTPQWVNSNNFNYQASYDLGAFTVRPVGGKQIQARTGGQGIVWGYSKRTYYMRAFGYPMVFLPSNKPTQQHRLYYCTGKTKGIRFHSKAPVSMSLACTMGGGASGGAWLYGMSEKGWGKIAGVNSTHSLSDNRMFSPYQGKAAADIYNWIKKK